MAKARNARAWKIGSSRKRMAVAILSSIILASQQMPAMAAGPMAMGGAAWEPHILEEGPAQEDEALAGEEEGTVRATAIYLDKDSMELAGPGRVGTLLYRIEPYDATDKSATWATSDASVATVSQGGIVTAVAPGTAEVTATSNDGGHAARCAVTVKGEKEVAPGPGPDGTAQAISLEASAPKAFMRPGETMQLSASYGLAQDSEVMCAWSSTDGSILAVDPDTGIAEARAEGTAVAYVDAWTAASPAPSRAGIAITVIGEGEAVPAQGGGGNGEPGVGTVRLANFFSTVTYDRKAPAKQPALKVYNGAALLAEGTDYKVSYAGNKGVGTARMTVTFMGDLCGKEELEFTIAPKSISSGDIGAQPIVRKFRKPMKPPAPVLEDGGQALKAGRDISFAYVDADGAPVQQITGPGTYTAIVSGKGCYAGERAVQATFLPSGAVPMGSVKTTVLKDQPYSPDGARPEPGRDFKVTYVHSGKAREVPASCYSTTYEGNMSTGKARAILTGNGTPDPATGATFFGTKEAAFTVIGTDIKKAAIMHPTNWADVLTYTGKPVRQRHVQLLYDKISGRYLEEGKDFTVSYKGNLHAGTATATFTGCGRYGGKVVKKFRIAKALIDAGCVHMLEEAQCSPAGARPAAAIVCGGRLLAEGTDYKASYSKNKKPGTGYITVKGIGDHGGTAKVPFEVGRAPMSSITLIAPDAAHGKDSWKSKPVAIAPDGSILKAGRDYTVSYSEKKCPTIGTKVTVAAKGKGAYEGTAMAGYTVMLSTKDISRAAIRYAGTPRYDSGAPVLLDEGELAVSMSGIDDRLEAGEDYRIIAYAGNTGTGRATAIFQGIGAYTGVKAWTFNIQKKELGAGHAVAAGSQEG